MVITGLLGAGVALDTFVVIMKIPSVFRRLFAEGAFNQAFVPVLAEYKEDNPNQIKNLIDNTFGALSTILLLVTTLALLFAPIFVMIFAPGFYMEPLKKDLAIDILQITFPYLFLVSLVAFSGSILNSYQKFSLPALTPLFYNLSLIAAAVWFAPKFELPIYAIAWGVFAAGIIQVFIQIPALVSMGLLPKFKLNMSHPGVRKVMYLMIPGIIAGGVSQINMLVDTILASLLPTGSPSWLYVSDRLMQLPLGIFAIAIGTSHGAYKFTRKPTGEVLAISRIAEIHKALPNTHLVMHGSSSVPQEWLDIINKYGGEIPQTYGVPVEEIQEGIRNGVRKVNIDTDNRLAFTAAVREAAFADKANFDPRHFNKPARKYMKQVCLDRYKQFWCEGQASKIKQNSTNYFADLYSKGDLDPKVKATI